MPIKEINHEKKIGRNVLWLGLGSFFNDISTEIILPILPMFILSLGGSSVVVGLVAGLRQSITDISNLFIGYWSDKTGKRKIFAGSGYLFSSICKFLLSFSKTWPIASIFAILERVGKSLRKTPIDTIIAESSKERIGFGFGIHRTLDTSGAIVGSLLSLIFLSFFNFSYHTIIMFSSFIGIFSLLPIIKVKDNFNSHSQKSFYIGITSFPRRLNRFFFISGIFYLSYFSYMFFVMRVHTIFSGSESIIMPVFLYLISNIFYASFSIPLGIIADKIGHKKIIMFGYTLFGLVSISFIYAKNITAFILLFAAYGIVQSMIEGQQRAHVSSMSIKNFEATSIGFFHTLTGTITLLANLTAGILWQYIRPESTFIFGGVISLFAVSLFFLMD